MRQMNHGRWQLGEMSVKSCGDTPRFADGRNFLMPDAWSRASFGCGFAFA